jgi:hypothetical protein
MTDIAELIRKLEAATEGNRGLDILIQAGVGRPLMWSSEDAPHYTTSLDAALTLVPDDWEWSRHLGANGRMSQSPVLTTRRNESMVDAGKLRLSDAVRLVNSKAVTGQASYPHALAAAIENRLPAERSPGGRWFVRPVDLPAVAAALGVTMQVCATDAIVGRHGQGANPAIALCIAALKARQSTQHEAPTPATGTAGTQNPFSESP